MSIVRSPLYIGKLPYGLGYTGVYGLGFGREIGDLCEWSTKRKVVNLATDMKSGFIRMSNASGPFWEFL